MTLAVAECFGRAAACYDQNATLQRRAADRLLDHAHPHTDPQSRWLDLGTGTGYVARGLKAPQVLALDLAEPMLKQARVQGSETVVCGDITRLPIQTGAVDGITANLALQWCNPLSATFSELARATRPGGKLLATLPLAHTFPELQPLVASGALACNRFSTLTQLSEALHGSGWSEFRLHAFTEVVHFESVRALLAHFKATGAHHSQSRQAGLRGRAWWQQLNQQLSQYADDQGYPLTWELVLVEATR
ncbi:methyltransferase domain-containing protein [Marinobacter hydrocarbonoclasticus]|nr:methyltransferase domain-containing protein [Marinobacter nauticus]